MVMGLSASDVCWAPDRKWHRSKNICCIMILWRSIINWVNSILEFRLLRNIWKMYPPSRTTFLFYFMICVKKKYSVNLQRHSSGCRASERNMRPHIVSIPDKLRMAVEGARFDDVDLDVETVVVVLKDSAQPRRDRMTDGALYFAEVKPRAADIGVDRAPSIRRRKTRSQTLHWKGIESLLIGLCNLTLIGHNSVIRVLHSALEFQICRSVEFTSKTLVPGVWRNTDHPHSGTWMRQRAASTQPAAERWNQQSL